MFVSFEDINKFSADPRPSSIIGGPSSIFKASSDRKKQSKTEKLWAQSTAEELSFDSLMSLRATGK